MTRIIEFLISLAIVAVLFIVVGFLLPSQRHVEHSVETNRNMSIVFDTISSFNRFTDWNVLPLRDPNMDIRISDPASGVGARLDYTSEEEGLGQGSWEIVDVVPGKSVSFAITDEERGQNKRTTYTLTPTGRNNRNVRITQTYDVDYGMNLLGRYSGMYVSSGVGEAMKMSLQRLANMLAAVPNYDYNEFEVAPTVVDRPAVNLLVVTAAVERNNDVVQRTMKNNLQWIERVMKENNLVADGPLRIITNEFGAENYSFDVAQPVRKADGASAPETAAEDGADAEDEVAGAEAAPAPAGKIEVELDGPVEHVFVEAHKEAMVPFTGHMATLPRVRDTLRAWVLTQGHETTGRPYEDWIKGIDDSFTEEGEFRVYWSIR